MWPWRRRSDEDFSDEIRASIALETDRLMADGMSPEEARVAALRAFGNVTRAQERFYEANHAMWLDDFRLDIRYAFRTLTKSPGFTAVAVLTFALGIGATTAIFSVVNGVLIKPLPFPEPGRLVSVEHVAALSNASKVKVSASLYFSYRDEGQAFEDIGLWSGSSFSVTGMGEPEEVRGLTVNDGMLSLLRVEPILGRRFTSLDDSPRGTETVILSFGYWQSRFGGDPSAIGRRIIVNGRPREVIGVLPQSFVFLNQQPSLITPFRFDRSTLVLGPFTYDGIARLKPGITLADANADSARVLQSHLAKWPPPPGVSTKLFEDARFGPNLQPLKQVVVGDVGKVLWIILGVIGIVLVIACANVVNLLLVKAEGRDRELSIRAALGAGTFRIARGLLFESLLLSSIGALVGLGLAHLALRLLTSMGPSHLPRLSEIRIDPMVMLFTLTIAVCGGVLFGLVPLVRYAAASKTRVLAGAGRTVSPGPERGRTRNTLAVVQVALALVLLISSVLMIRTFQATRRVEPGFTPAEEVRTTRIFIPEGQVREPERVARMQHDILESISRIPSVTSVAFATSVPLDGNSGGDVVFVEGLTYPPGKLPPIRRFKFVSPGIFHTLGNRMLAGRDFTWTDVHERRAVAIVSDNLARELWGDPLAAIGRRIRMTPTSPWREIIAVVGDVRHDGVHQEPPPTVYWPVLMDLFVDRPALANRSVVFAIHSQRTDDASLLREIQEAVWAVNPNLPLADVRTLAEIYQRSMAQTSFAVVMLVIAGGMALVLSLVGIYSVISYAVAQRTREIGIRVALGAPPPTVRRMFVRQGLLLAAGGVACGVVAALAVMRSMSSLLFEVSPVDAPTYGAVALGLVAAVVVATYLPARRATKVDPLVALRCE